ncbi:MAG: HprK-related kinase B, partial [Pseudomonadota bacterium]
MDTETFVSTLPDTPHSITFDFQGFVIGVRSTTRELISLLAEYYHHFVVQHDRVSQATWPNVIAIHQTQPMTIDGDWRDRIPDPGKTRVKEQVLKVDNGYVVRKIQTGVHLFLLAGKDQAQNRICTGDLITNTNQVINFINNIHLDALLSDRGELFHASGVCTDRGSGCGMGGASGKGKSTLALRLLSRGLDLVSNDRLVVWRDQATLVMHGIAKYPRVNPGTLL